MKRIPVAAITIGVIFLATMSMSAQKETVVTRHPAKISKDDLSGKIFERPGMIGTNEDGNVTLDLTTLLSRDRKFASGMYRSGKVRSEIVEPWGVDEFMYFLEGGVTLTSSDGTVQTINTGEAVTIAKEWTGVWDTDGYTKIWVIYSEDGSGL